LRFQNGNIGNRNTLGSHVRESLLLTEAFAAQYLEQEPLVAGHSDRK
jgi:hypothetical protein